MAAAAAEGQREAKHVVVRSTGMTAGEVAVVAAEGVEGVDEAGPRLHTVHTWGYSKRSPADLEAVLTTLAPAVVVDTRHNPRNAADGWTKRELEATFGEAYIHATGFGNTNYPGARGRGEAPAGAHPDVPILADVESGCALVAQLRQTSAVVLICVCPAKGKCHRHAVARELAARGVPSTELSPRGEQRCRVARCCGVVARVGRSAATGHVVKGASTRLTPAGQATSAPASLTPPLMPAAATAAGYPTPAEADHESSRRPARRRGRGTMWGEQQRTAKAAAAPASVAAATATATAAPAAPTPAEAGIASPPVAKPAGAAWGPAAAVGPAGRVPAGVVAPVQFVADKQSRRGGGSGAAAVAAPAAASHPSKKARRGGERMVRYPWMSDDEVAAITVQAETLADRPDILRATLATHGVAVVADVLPPAECAQMEALWRSDLLELVDRQAAEAVPVQAAALAAVEGPGGIEAWPGENNDHIGAAWRGFATHRGLPHGRFAWGCRLHPAVRAAFAALHAVEPGALCTGLDNVMWQGFQFPQVDENTEWLHCDQNHNTGLTWPIVQGILYVRPSGSEHASTTVVWPGSHTEHYDAVMSDPRAHELGKSMKGQLVKLNTLKSPAGRRVHAAAVGGARRIPVPAGSLLLWDSRSTHQGWCGGPRLAQPVCWEPRARRDDAALRRKLWMCATGVGSSHSSTEGRVHQMAPRAPAKALAGCSEPVVLPLRPHLVPHGVRPDKRDAWARLHKRLWGSNKERQSRRNADNADLDAIRPLLRDEVVAVL